MKGQSVMIVKMIFEGAAMNRWPPLTTRRPSGVMG